MNEDEDDLCQEFEKKARFRDVPVCNVCNTTKLITMARRELGKCVKCDKVKENEVRKQEEMKAQNEKKQEVMKMWEDALEVEKFILWKAERELFAHLPKPYPCEGTAYNKWRRWNDPSFRGFIGEKFPVPEEAGVDVKEEPKQEEQ